MNPELLPRDGLVVFFKNRCGACEVAVPHLRRLVGTVPLLAVCQDERPAEFADGLEVAVDAPGLEASGAFGFEAVPAYLVLRDGEVVELQMGWERERFNRLAERLGAGPDLVPAGDGPDFRPG